METICHLTQKPFFNAQNLETNPKHRFLQGRHNFVVHHRIEVGDRVDVVLTRTGALFFVSSYDRNQIQPVGQ